MKRTRSCDAFRGHEDTPRARRGRIRRFEGSMVNWPDFVTGIFGGAAGSIVVVYGLSRWLGDVWKAKILEKVQQDNRVELQMMKSEMEASVAKANRLLDAGISKAVLVTRTHFETEFAAYKEIFAALSDVKNYLHAVRPVFII